MIITLDDKKQDCLHIIYFLNLNTVINRETNYKPQEHKKLAKNCLRY